jgi:hypothetical protein
MGDADFSSLVNFLSGDAPVSIEASDVRRGLTPAQIAARTLHFDGEAWTFQTSNAKGSRTAKVPAGKWASFTDFLRLVAGDLEGHRATLYPAEPQADNPAQGDTSDDQGE